MLTDRNDVRSFRLAYLNWRYQTSKFQSKRPAAGLRNEGRLYTDSVLIGYFYPIKANFILSNFSEKVQSFRLECLIFGIKQKSNIIAFFPFTPKFWGVFKAKNAAIPAVFARFPYRHCKNAGVLFSDDKGAAFCRRSPQAPFPACRD
ncbi:MAG: hypothetical protein K0R24_182 [Gammaproteobacteria bacterium]|jgi:hypothetical protein|nr:hypothetical protein [Gammaproteobacteria bacterium]